MGLFGKNKNSNDSIDGEYRGGCAEHDMRGPARKTLREANRDANAHSKRFHGTYDNPSGYVEHVDRRR